MKMKSLLVAAAATIAFGSPALATTNLVSNGGFEMTDLSPSSPKEVFSTHVMDWTDTGTVNLNFIATAGSADAATPPYLSVYPGFPAASPDGGNFVMADAEPRFGAAITQTLTGLTAGLTYNLSFYQAAGQQVGFSGDYTAGWEVSFGGTTWDSKSYSLTTGEYAPWELQTHSFVATSSTQVLSFLAVGTPNGGPPVSFLDGVTLTAVPEPATWAMMIAGVGAVGAMARRRKTTGVASLA
jgi:hypothetical protein